MIVKIDKKEIDAVKYICALHDFKVSFYTIESNPLMVQVEIRNEFGDEVSPGMAWHLGKSVEIKLQCQSFSKT